MKVIVCAILLFIITHLMLFAQNAELPRLAVVEFSTNLKTDKVKADAITVRNLVENQIIRTQKYQIITREEIDKLLANQGIQASNISSKENIQKLILQNIKYIVTGSVDAIGNDYAVIVKILDVSTGKFSHSADDSIKNNSLYIGINSLMVKFLSGLSTSSGGIIEGIGTYNIGDTGPAGGIIFYDKSYFSDGWRYLEAAPAGTDFIAQWGAYEKSVPGTRTAVGSGKRNTQLIIERLKVLGENNCAAQICVGMDINGYKDWFLPSKDELELMYINLASRGKGGFSYIFYWSSSQTEYNYAWLQDFIDSYQYDHYENNKYSVRAVRAF